MIAALIAGKCDGAKLAELAMGKMRPKVTALTEALAGQLGSHHARCRCRQRSKEPRDGAASNLILISNHDETEST